MNGLIARIQSNDPDMEGTLFLTSECETPEELSDLERALGSSSKNATNIDRVVYRECFFPLRRVRPYLGRDDFETMLRVVSGIENLRELELRSCVPGILAGRKAVPTYENATRLRRFEARGAITFLSRTHDVDPLAGMLRRNADHLRFIDLGDSHFMLARNRIGTTDDAPPPSSMSPPSRHATTTPMLLDPIMECSLPHLEQFVLSSATAPLSSSPPPSASTTTHRRCCLVSSNALRTFLWGGNEGPSAADAEARRPSRREVFTTTDKLLGGSPSSSPKSSLRSLTHLHLNRLGLDDGHLFVIAEFLSSTTTTIKGEEGAGGGAYRCCPSLQVLEVRGNPSITEVGNRALVGSLRCNASLKILRTTRPTAVAGASSTSRNECGGGRRRRRRRRSSIPWGEVFANNFSLEILSDESSTEEADPSHDARNGGGGEEGNGYRTGHHDAATRNNDGGGCGGGDCGAGGGAYNYDVDEELQFWLGLNRMGRRRWWRDRAADSSREDWIYVLEGVSLLSSFAAASESLDSSRSVLYHLVRSYPTKLGEP
jgi:hypothetical protein